MAKNQEVRDYGWNNYLKQLDDNLSYVDVGVVARDGAKKMPPTSEGKQTDITMAELATIQEFGTVIQVTDKMRGFLGATGMNLKKSTKVITIPSRAFTRQTFDENLKDLDTLVNKKESEIIAGKTTRREALTMIGQTHQNQIKRNMASGKWAPNHPYTVSRKKSSQPLINNSHLRNAINFEVG